MNEMVERVALAMQKAAEGNPGDFSADRPAHCYVICAKAAIQAMREPTDGMSCTSIIAMRNNCVHGVLPTGDEAADIWRAMIDEALSDHRPARQLLLVPSF